MIPMLLAAMPKDLYFRSKCTEKRLAAGLRPDPLGEPMRSQAPSRYARDGETSFPDPNAPKNVWRSDSARTRWGSLSFPQALAAIPETSFFRLKCTEKRLAAGLRPDPLENLSVPQASSRYVRDLIFRSKCTEKRLAAGLRLDPLENLSVP